MKKTIRGKRGLSEVLATLMIILLVLIAVGIIWLVVRNVVQGGADQIEIAQKCLGVSLEAVSLNETSSGNYTVVLSRGSDDKGEIGVMVNILKGTTGSGEAKPFGAFGALTAGGQLSLILPATTGADRVQVTAYFHNSAGKNQSCTNTNTFTF